MIVSGPFDARPKLRRRSLFLIGSLAGAETTVSSATALVYVLASYPEVQAKGQAEIDAVIGSDRLPLVTDRKELPYVHAIVKEVSRWYTVVPLGESHCIREDDSSALISTIAVVPRCASRQH